MSNACEVVGASGFAIQTNCPNGALSFHPVECVRNSIRTQSLDFQRDNVGRSLSLFWGVDPRNDGDTFSEARLIVLRHGIEPNVQLIPLRILDRKYFDQHPAEHPNIGDGSPESDPMSFEPVRGPQNLGDGGFFRLIDEGQEEDREAKYRAHDDAEDLLLFGVEVGQKRFRRH